MFFNLKELAVNISGQCLNHLRFADDISVDSSKFTTNRIGVDRIEQKVQKMG